MLTAAVLDVVRTEWLHDAVLLVTVPDRRHATVAGESAYLEDVGVERVGRAQPTIS
jgi:hypothetical protein